MIGAGPVGALAHRLAQLGGAGPVTVVANSRRREQAALRAGAARFATLEERLDDLGATTVIEATGDADAIGAAVAAAAPGGTVVLLGSPRAVTRALPLGEIRRKRLRLAGAHISAFVGEAMAADGDPFQELAATYLDGLASRRIDVADLVGEPVDPREIGLTYGRLAAGELQAAHLDWTRLAPAERFHGRRLLDPPRLAPRRPAARLAAPAPAAAARDGRRLRFAAIGCGDVGLPNARAIARSPLAELVVCHDAVPALREAAAEELGCRAAATLEEALDATAVDAVFLSVPHDLHAPLAAQAARAGLHVVVEKPLAADLDGRGRRPRRPPRPAWPSRSASRSAMSPPSRRRARSSPPARSGRCAAPRWCSTPTSPPPTGRVGSPAAPPRTGVPGACGRVVAC